MTTRCCCCGPTAVQRRCLNGYLSFINDSKIKDREHEHHERIIQCTNPKCNRVQYFSCAMLFMDRVLEKVPHYVSNILPWVRALRDYYNRNKQGCDQLPSVIEVPCCISCSLSITIPDGMCTVLQPLMAPIRITEDESKPIIVAEGIISSNLNENDIEYEDNTDEDDEDDNNDNNNYNEDDDDDYANREDDVPVLLSSKRQRLIADGVKGMIHLPSLNYDTY